MCIIGRAVTMHFHSDLADFYEPQQLGATTKGGLDVLVYLVRMHLEENPAQAGRRADSTSDRTDRRTDGRMDTDGQMDPDCK